MLILGRQSHLYMVFSNGYRGASLYGLATFYIVNGMVGCQELAVRANLSIVADGDWATVKHGAIVVDEHILT